MAHAVLLDVDGTLVDSNDLHARAWREAMLQHGHDVPLERLRDLIGKGGDKLVPEVTGFEPETPEYDALSRTRAALFRGRFLPQVRPFAQVRALLERLSSDGYALAVATSAQEEELGGLLERSGVADLIGETTTSDDAERSKPDPDIVQAALAKLGMAGGDALMLGDTPYDVEAATRAGVPIVAVRSGGWDDEALRGALAIYADVADLLDHYDASPFARRRPAAPG